MKWKKQIVGMKAYEPGRSIEEVKSMYGLSEIVKLASNENPLGTSPKVTEFIDNHSLKFERYPDGYSSVLRTALAKHLGVEENQLLFGNGSDEIILIIARALLQPGVNTVMANPTFPQYRHNARIEGAEVREVPLKEGMHDLEEMLNQIDEQTAVVWLCSPNNPTGTLLNQQELNTFIQSVPSNVLIVLDEAYFEYITEPTYLNPLTYINNYKNVVVLRTFSKAYGIAAFRVGYAIGHADLISNLETLREPFNNTSLSQGVAIAALNDQAFIEQCRSGNERGKKQFEEYSSKNQLHLYPSEGNFVLLEVKVNSDDVFERLLKRGYIIRSGNALGVPNYIRITIGTQNQNHELLDHLTEVLLELGVFQ
ncbi:MAG: histidinol-phosphate transaminase [Paenisporosarcina sp.]